MELLRSLIVSPDLEVSEKIRIGLTGLEHCTASIVPTLAEAKRTLEQSLVDLIVIDLEQEDAIDLVLAVRHNLPNVAILAITDMTMRQHDREAIKLGVEGFIVKPVRWEHVQFQAAHVRELQRLREQNLQLRSVVGHTSGFDQILGLSGEMKQVFNLLLRAAGSNAPVAIYGESGTGKELIARAIHNHCASSAGPFISINPSAIPETLLESELFGHMRGAFTGASSDRVGYIEAAHGGTLFLDEIGDLPLSFQGKFLRVLQERVLHRVGSTKRISVDFRLITATNRDMPDEVRAGRFREDLYYRIHVFPIQVPPLRQRVGDIPLLAEHFLHRYAADLRRNITGFAPGAVELLLNYDWPGNVRELDNVIHRLVAMKPEDSPVSATDLTGLLPRGARAFSASSAETGVIGGAAQVAIKPLDEHVRDYVRWVYESLGRNKARTARLLEIDRTTLYRKIKDIDKGE